MRKAKDRETALSAISQLVIGLRVCAIDYLTVAEALNINLKDFEDEIQLACATLNQLDAIVTRDISDFSGINFQVLSVSQLQARLSQLE